jgi:hypothetical protein
MAAGLANGTSKLAKHADGTFWMKDITCRGFYLGEVIQITRYVSRSNRDVDRNATPRSIMCHLWLTETDKGSTNDTAAVQQIFNDHGTSRKIIFVNSSTYILTETVTIPKDVKVHGEAWSQFAAYGNAFSTTRYAFRPSKWIYADTISATHK